MDSVNINKHVQAWLASNEGRVDSMSMQIQKIRDEHIEISIDGKVLQLTIPDNFYTNCSSDGIISNTYCAFVVTVAKGKFDESNSLDTGLDLIAALNENLDRLSRRESYSFRSVLDSIVDAFEKYKSSNCGPAPEIDDDDAVHRGSSDCDRYSMAAGTSTDFSQNKGSLKNGYFEQLIDEANKICDEARSMAMSTRTETPCNENRKFEILRWCKLYSPSHNDWCVGFEIDLTGILSDYCRQRHGHLFEAIGFSFTTPLLIEVKFQPLGGSSGLFNIISLQSQQKSLSKAYRGVLAAHRSDVEFKNSSIKGNFVYDDGDLDDQIATEIDGNTANPMHLYGLKYLLPRLAKDFFSRGGRDPDNKNNVLLTCEGNIFVRFLLFIGNCLASLLKRCIICNKELLFRGSRLGSCADELCILRFQVIGLGAQVLQEVIRMPLEVIELEISLAMAAADSFRDVFEPFPSSLLEKRKVRQRSGLFDSIRNLYRRPNPISGSVNNNKMKNLDVMRNIINSFPPVSKMRLCSDEHDLKAELAKTWLCTPELISFQKFGLDKYSFTEIWELPYNVLQFILSTNRLSLVFLSENDDKLLKVEEPQSKVYQFAVVQDSADSELSNREKQATTFAFHGSPPGNWYSILRNGLRCLSNTKLMSSGNRLGNGIYLSNDYTLSMAFSAGRSKWQNGMYKGRSLYVVSICEVVSSFIKENENSYIIMVPQEHEKSVVLRYLLVCVEDRSLVTTKILDGHILSFDLQNVNLAEHYQRIRQKFTAGSSS